MYALLCTAFTLDVFGDINSEKKGRSLAALGLGRRKEDPSFFFLPLCLNEMGKRPKEAKCEGEREKLRYSRWKRERKEGRKEGPFEVLNTVFPFLLLCSN